MQGSSKKAGGRETTDERRGKEDERREKGERRNINKKETRIVFRIWPATSLSNVEGAEKFLSYEKRSRVLFDQSDTGISFHFGS